MCCTLLNKVVPYTHEYKTIPKQNSDCGVSDASGHKGQGEQDFDEKWPRYFHRFEYGDAKYRNKREVSRIARPHHKSEACKGDKKRGKRRQEQEKKF